MNLDLAAIITAAVILNASATGWVWLHQRHARTIEANAWRRRLAAEHEARITAEANAARHRGIAIERTVELAAAKLKAEVARPPSPLVSYLAHHGPTSIDDLTDKFGPRTGTKLLEVMETQEVEHMDTVDMAGRPVTLWRWKPPSKRLSLAQPDLTDTIEPPRWLPTNSPPPPDDDPTTRLSVVAS